MFEISDVQAFKLPNADVFVLSVPSSCEASFKWMVYAPLSRACFSIGAQIRAELQGEAAKWSPALKDRMKQLAEVRIPSIPRWKETIPLDQKLVVIPTQTCNLGCVYCYAHDAHCGKVIDISIFSSAIEDWCSHISKKGEVSFIGGGEPLFDWNLFAKYVNIIQSLAAKSGKNISISVTTNGTLLDETKIEKLAEWGVRVGVSFDILPEVQNKNRPFASGRGSHDCVLKNLRALIDVGIAKRIRTTITESCVDQMPDMVQYVATNIKGIESIHFEHVTDAAQSTDVFYGKFIDSFFQAKRLAKKNKIELRNSIQTSLSRISRYFCKGELCLTPDGTLVSCHRKSSPDDSDFDTFRFGSVENGKLSLSQDWVRQNLLSNRASADCEECFCKWHCAGGCPMMNKALQHEQKTSFCRFARNFTLRLLVEKIHGKGTGED